MTDCNNLRQQINTFVERLSMKFQFIRKKKKKSLGYIPDDNVAIDKLSFNLSSRELCPEELNVLAKGLKYSFSLTETNYIPFFFFF